MASPTGGYGGEGGMSGGSRSTSQPLTAREIKTKNGREIVSKSDIDILEKELEIKINRSEKLVLTYGDLKNITKNPIYISKQTTFKMDCIVEKIPVPKINRVLGLNTTPKNTINKEPVLILQNSYGEDVEYPSNYIKDIGATISLKILGDLKTNYNLVVKDITNTKWYNWSTEQFQHGYNSKQDIVDLVSEQLIIPPQSSETKYHVFFSKKECGLTDYSSDMPTEENPWVIYQLMKATTTFSFGDNDDRFIPDTTVSKTCNPGVVINTLGSANHSKLDFTITVLPKRSGIKLSNEDLTSVKVDNKSFYSPESSLDKTSILDTDLIASVDSSNSTGTITGTITLERSSIRDYNYTINPTDYFTII